MMSELDIITIRKILAHRYPFLLIDKVLKLVGFNNPLDKFPDELSGGEQQMLSIARTLMGNPDVLLLDEPSEGLAPIIVQDIAKLIKNLQNTEVTIIIAEQNIRFCFAIADNAAIIDKGTIVYENTISELKKDTKTLKKYLAV